MVPVDGKAEPIAITRLGNLVIENPKEWDWRLPFHLEFIVLGTRERRLTRTRSAAAGGREHGPQGKCVDHLSRRSQGFVGCIVWLGGGRGPQ